MTTVAELLDGHVTLDISCVDRLYLNGYVAKLATPEGLVGFFRGHLGKPIPSPALLNQITTTFRESVKRFASTHGIPLIEFRSGERKDDRANALRAERGVRDEVVFVGVAQEKATAFSAREAGEAGSGCRFQFRRDKKVFVNHYYFYVDDAEFGPAFIKVCSYAPWALKICLNGHEWAKRQLERRGISFEALDNGFKSCSDPMALQTICDELGPDHVRAFLDRWLDRLPMPLQERDRQAGYGYEISIWQMEVSRTQVFEDPSQGRQFFEEVLRDNLDLGRPDRVQLLFERRVTQATPGRFRTRVIQEGVSPSLHIEYKETNVKQYFKENRALRTETTFRNPADFKINKGLKNFPYLVQVGRHINQRLLDVERVSQNSGFPASSIQRVVQPTVTEDGRKAPGLRFGQPRVMALMVTLSLFSPLIGGLRNADLRESVSSLLNEPYSARQASYDLRRLSRKGILCRHHKSHRYRLTPHGWKMARCFARLEARVFRPFFAAADGTPVAEDNLNLRKAFDDVDHLLDQLTFDAFPGKSMQA
jgi:hypothetical protein